MLFYYTAICLLYLARTCSLLLLPFIWCGSIMSSFPSYFKGFQLVTKSFPKLTPLACSLFMFNCFVSSTPRGDEISSCFALIVEFMFRVCTLPSFVLCDGCRRGRFQQPSSTSPRYIWATITVLRFKLCVHLLYLKLISLCFGIALEPYLARLVFSSEKESEFQW